MLNDGIQQSFIAMNSCFHLQSDYEPRGDQRQAIDKLVKSLNSGNNHRPCSVLQGLEKLSRWQTLSLK